MLNPVIQAVSWQSGVCRLLDQTRLPGVEITLDCRDYRDVVGAISRLAVRGAPAIGIAGAYAYVLAVNHALKLPVAEREGYLKKAVQEIAEARPTAVNLRWAVDRMSALHRELKLEFTPDAAAELERLAVQIHRDDVESNRKIADFGADLLPKGKAVVTICNTGDLATGGIGTAFGVFRNAFLQGKVTKVYACETRPVLQGLRLTSYELQKNNIPFSMVTDGMAAITLRDSDVGSVIVGADRIAGNGDVANKVGTYSLAVLARHHGVPFYVAAPFSSFDLSLESGSQIPIEHRADQEVYSALGSNLPKEKMPVFNPAFDVTPADLITAIICERGVVKEPAKNGGVMALKERNS